MSVWASSPVTSLFLIPEEYNPPQALLATDQYTHENRWHALNDGFIRAVVDPQQNALACSLATARHGQAEPIEWLRQERVRHALKVGPAALSNHDRLQLLSDPVALARLHEQVGRRSQRLAGRLARFGEKPIRMRRYCRCDR